MADTPVIRHPIAWALDHLRQIVAIPHRTVESPRTTLQLRHLTNADIFQALREGWRDFMACRSDVMALCLVYPFAGILIGRLVTGYQMLPLLFPLISGFALLGPLLATGLYELSKRRENGEAVGWGATFAPFSSPAFFSLVGMGLILLAIFVLWLISAALIYDLTLGPIHEGTLWPTAHEPANGFIHDALHTPRGLTMTALVVGVGGIYAFVALTISSVAFPLLLDRNCGVEAAMRTSAQAMAQRTGTMLTWGAIVAAGLALGSAPFLLGLVVVMPVLGHATWHLYRRLVF